jgi:8-oxo-dGTP pyrophosphatase MutT (NUDIX family)
MEVRRSRSMGGIVLGDHGTIAMVRHRNSNGSWLFPKGKAEAEETDEQAARREIAEEAGLTNLELLDDLGSYERHPILPDGTEDRTEMKEIHMYLFAAEPGATLAPTMEIDAARWIPLQNVVIECGNVTDGAWFARMFERIRQSVQRD